jgi:hypothetical protein
MAAAEREAYRQARFRRESEMRGPKAKARRDRRTPSLSSPCYPPDPKLVNYREILRRRELADAEYLEEVSKAGPLGVYPHECRECGGLARMWPWADVPLCPPHAFVCEERAEMVERIFARHGLVQREGSGMIHIATPVDISAG